MIIGLKEKKEWKNKGYTIVRGALDNTLVKECKKCIENKYNFNTPPQADFGSINGEFEFPSNTIFDKLTLNSNIINAVSYLLDTKDILLTQSDAWSKMGMRVECGDHSQSNRDQRIHMDYGNHSFLHVSNWDKPEVVAIIIYLSDTELTGGGTAVVPKNSITSDLYEIPYINMPGQHNYTFNNDKETAETYFQKNYPEVYKFRNKLYQNEIVVNAKPGDILFYRLDLWHRGTPVKPNNIRHVVNLAFKKKECYWINNWNKSFTKGMYYGKIERLICSLTPRQCSVIGIPPVGDPIWNEERLKNIKARYPNFNIKPYLSKL
jgi:ectoine hydroxylase-related dioxygenase (phytanoyl-CoA dioxygenase family)